MLETRFSLSGTNYEHVSTYLNVRTPLVYSVNISNESMGQVYLGLPVKDKWKPALLEDALPTDGKWY